MGRGQWQLGDQDPVIPHMVEAMREALDVGFSRREVEAIIRLAYVAKRAANKFQEDDLIARCGQLLEVIEGEDRRTRRKGEW